MTEHSDKDIDKRRITFHPTNKGFYKQRESGHQILGVVHDMTRMYLTLDDIQFLNECPSKKLGPPADVWKRQNVNPIPSNLSWRDLVAELHTKGLFQIAAMIEAFCNLGTAQQRISMNEVLEALRQK